MRQVARNELCPCGSGRKYEQCCGQHGTTPAPVGRPALAALDIPKAIQSALEHHRAGRLPQAKFAYQQVLQAAPNHDQALHLLGVVAKQEGDGSGAAELISRAIRENPSNPGYHFNLGCTYNALNRHDDAIDCYRRALSIKTDYVEALNNLGNTLKMQGRLDEAIAHYRKITLLMPDDVVAHNNLGVALESQGRADDAVTCYKMALTIRPDYAEAHSNLGVALKRQGQMDAAIACFKQALAIRPDYADPHNNLGNIRKDQGRLDEAIACYQMALAINPDYDEAHSNLGNTLGTLGRVDEAIACYQKALAVRPAYADAHNNMLFAMHHTSFFSPDELFAEHLKFAAQFEAPLKNSWRPHGNRRDPEKRLKVGYISPDFRNHAVAYFVEPVFDHHDKSRVEVFCYYNHAQHDAYTDRIKARADHWLQCADMTDDQLAERIRADGIDILVDLAGHTGGNRLLMFARKPAPVQVTYLGYIHTTGLSAIDYRLTHIDADPPGSERYYSETLYRLPGGFWWCYRPRPDMPEVAPPPALANGYVTFGSTNTFAKLSSETIVVWATILRAVPTARLLIAGVPDGSARQLLAERFAAQGIDVQRLILQNRVPVTQFWALHHQIDIVLDPFPYNGGTTTCIALWLGVPVVALTGQVLVSRMGYALLKNLGLPELAAGTVRDYVNIAVGLAGDLARLVTLRTGMRARLEASPLRDEVRFTRRLETAYREMWQKWCAMRSPDFD